MSLAIVALACATLIYLYERTRFLFAPRFAPAAKVVQAEPLPWDLYAIAARESEGWAREQALQAIREAYDETQDWRVVRQRFGTEQGE